MVSHSIAIRPEEPADEAAIAALNDEAFGPGRYARAAYALREAVPHQRSLSFVAMAGEELIGSVRLTPIRIAGEAGLLLGPLAVRSAWAGRGAGRGLVRTAVEAARRDGHALVLLVGDEPYYGPLGFRALSLYALTLPRPVDPARVLLAELRPGALDGLRGSVERWSEPAS